MLSQLRLVVPGDLLYRKSETSALLPASAKLAIESDQC